MGGACLICAGEYVEDVVAHLETEHGMTFQRWPDGAVVVVDSTLVPADFGGGGMEHAGGPGGVLVLVATAVVAFVLTVAVAGLAAMAAARRWVQS